MTGKDAKARSREVWPVGILALTAAMVGLPALKRPSAVRSLELNLGLPSPSKAWSWRRGSQWRRSRITPIR